MPLLDRPTDGGGDGPPVFVGPGGKPFMLMVPWEPPEVGGETRFPRLGKDPSSLAWYREKDHSLPPTETGDSGALRSLMVLMVGGKAEAGGKGKRLAQTPRDGGFGGLRPCLTVRVYK